MSKIVVTNNLTLDGVMQSPSGPEEDVRNDFAHGGWAVPYSDEDLGRAMRRDSERRGALLFGRRTFEQFASYWPTAPADIPWTAVLNDTRKYVASTTLSEPLAWRNSELLTGDAVDAVAALKEQPGKDIVILGSGELVRSLLPHGLIDEFVLNIHPLVLGSGRRLFGDDGAYAKLELVDARTTSTGIVIATYTRSAS
jgi:dihydrofolate reductase